MSKEPTATEILKQSDIEHGDVKLFPWEKCMYESLVDMIMGPRPFTDNAVLFFAE